MSENSQNRVVFKSLSGTKKTTILAMLTAISVISVYLFRFPAFLPFLEYDPADIPIFLATFAFGPSVGFILTSSVAIIQGFTVSAGSEIIGVIMHICSTGSFVLAASAVYSKTSGKAGGRIAACVSGTIVRTIVMVLWNILLTPVFMKLPRADIIPLILPAIIPFNLMKSAINSAVALVLFRPFSRAVNSLSK